MFKEQFFFFLYELGGEDGVDEVFSALNTSLQYVYLSLEGLNIS